jgi:hypothetical protein
VTARVPRSVDREWRRLIGMVVAVALVLVTLLVVGKLNPATDTQLDHGAKGRTNGATSTAPGSRVGGQGHYQYKVLP